MIAGNTNNDGAEKVQKENAGEDAVHEREKSSEQSSWHSTSAGVKFQQEI
jgi:hypothetical protein